MLKRKNEANTDEHTKKTKLSDIAEEIPKLLLITRDDLSNVLDFLDIGQVIVFSLSCKHIYNCVKEHVEMIHPYVVHPSYEWSIGRALKTYRKLVVNEWSIDKLNDVFDSIIENNEPISKLTKVVELGNGLDLQKVFNLFSKPSGQSQENVKFIKLDKVCKPEKLDDKDEEYEDEDDEYEEDDEYYGYDEYEEEEPRYQRELPIVMRNLKSIPIGFLVKELSIDTKVSLSKLYRVLVHFNSLETLKLKVSSEGSKKLVGEVPIFEKLKHLELTTFRDHDELKITRNLLKLTPNLEYLELRYSKQAADDNFLDFLTKHCPNLKAISISEYKDENGSYAKDLKFTDNGVFRFLTGEPKLEYLEFSHFCPYINGEILSKIGQFNNLRLVSLFRDRSSEDIVPQCRDLKFGGGVLDKLEYIFFGHDLSVSHFTQSEKDNFISSLIEMAPNIRDVGTLGYVRGIELLDYADQLAPLLTLLSIDKPTETKKLDYWLKKSKKLEEILFKYHCDLSSIDPVPSVKKLVVYYNTSLRELSGVFPSVTELNYDYNEKELTEILKEGIWPDLKILNPLYKDMLQVRPNLYESYYKHNKSRFTEVSKVEDENLQFVKEWLILDQDEQNRNTSKILKFLAK